MCFVQKLSTIWIKLNFSESQIDYLWPLEKSLKNIYHLKSFLREFQYAVIDS